MTWSPRVVRVCSTQKNSHHSFHSCHSKLFLPDHYSGNGQSKRSPWATQVALHLTRLHPWCHNVPYLHMKHCRWVTRTTCLRSGLHQATYNTDSPNICKDGLIRWCSVLKSSAHLVSWKAEVWELLRISASFDFDIGNSRISELRFGSRWAEEDALYRLRRAATRSPCVRSRATWSAARALEDFEQCWRRKDHLDQKSSWARKNQDPGRSPLPRDLRHKLDIDTLEQCPISSPYNINWAGSETNVLILKDTPLNGGRKSCHDVSWSKGLGENPKPRVILFVPGVFLSSCYFVTLCYSLCLDLLLPWLDERLPRYLS